jgi:putative membrane protein insertion efficiency factor
MLQYPGSVDGTVLRQYACLQVKSRAQSRCSVQVQCVSCITKSRLNGAALLASKQTNLGPGQRSNRLSLWDSHSGRTTPLHASSKEKDEKLQTHGDEPEGTEEGNRDETQTESAGVRVALAVLRFYKREISPILPPSCRFLPTCSEYAMESYQRFGVGKGTILTGWRLMKCNPFGMLPSVLQLSRAVLLDAQDALIAFQLRRSTSLQVTPLQGRALFAGSSNETICRTFSPRSTSSAA